MKPHTTIAPSKLAMHAIDSCAIFKPKPKIRIIHVFEPEIITTDVENFRELVQRLTGKPAEKKLSKKPEDTYSTESSLQMNKESEEIYKMENPNYFLSFLGEIDGFISDMNEFPIQDPFSFGSSQMNTTFGEMPLC